MVTMMSTRANDVKETVLGKMSVHETGVIAREFNSYVITDLMADIAQLTHLWLQCAVSYGREYTTDFDIGLVVHHIRNIRYLTCTPTSRC